MWTPLSTSVDTRTVSRHPAADGSVVASPVPSCPQVCLVGGRRVALRLGARTLELDEDALEALKSGGVEGALAALHVRGRAHAPASAVSDEHPWLPLIIGEYVITGAVGRGSSGVVVRALDQTTHERLAIKLLHVDEAEVGLDLNAAIGA